MRLEKLNEYFDQYSLFEGGDFVLQSDFDPITRDFALEVGHQESLLKDIETEGFLDIALRSCGGMVQAVDDIMAGNCANAYATIPVGGHHAGPSSHWGFCYLNDIACAVHQLRATHQAQKILYVDQDFHHADGTDKFFHYDPDFFYICAHAQKAGELPGAKIDKTNNNVDIILPRGMGGDDFASVIKEALDFALNKRQFAPDFIIAYCGYDAHVLDDFNRGTLRVDHRAFVELANVYFRLADHFCGGRLLCIQGGGYNAKRPEIAATCTFNTIAVLGQHSDLILEANAPSEESDSIARIKTNSIMRDFTRAKY